MRVYCGILLVTATVFATFDAASTAQTTDISHLNVPVGHRGVANSIQVARFLRTIGDDEARGLTLPTTGKLTDLFESTALKVAQTARIKKWLLKGTSTDDAYIKLGLNTAGSKIFEDSKLLTWAVYVTKVEKQNPEEIILARLSKQFTEGSLAKMIASAKRVSKTEGLATILQAQQRQVWLNAGKSSDEVFKLLQLDEAGTKLFKNQQFSTWTSFVRVINPNGEVSILKKLTKSYDEATLAKMIEGSMKVPSTESIATKLQTQQNRLWLSQGKCTDDVFKLLKLDDVDIGILVDPRLNAWTSYMKDFNSANPGKEVTLVGTLTTHYKDLGLAQLLEQAKAIPSTKKIAEDLQVAQFTRWFHDGKSQDDVFKLLQLKQITWTTDPDTVILRQYNKFYKAMMASS